jgi:hypothetical protein
MVRPAALLASLALLALTGCTKAADAPVAPASGAPAFSDAATSAEIHAALLTPGSDALFAAESEPPKTDEGWIALEAAAGKVVDGARLLQTGARPAGRADWIRIAKAVQDGAQKSAEAAHAGNADALAAADGDFIAHCEDCHNAFRDAGGGMMTRP